MSPIKDEEAMRCAHPAKCIGLARELAQSSHLQLGGHAMTTGMFFGSPLRDLRRLQEEMDRLARSVPAPQGFPALNVYAHQDGIVITAELPGVQEDDLDITVHRDTVTLRGERQDKSDDAGAYHRRERGSGTFVRTFGLPFQVDPDKVVQS